jgi:hypothetical protein
MKTPTGARRARAGPACVGILCGICNLAALSCHGSASSPAAKPVHAKKKHHKAAAKPAAKPV